MRNQSNIKIAIVTLLIIALIVVGIGFAAFSTNLSIFGTAKINSSSWNVYFSNITRDSSNSTSGIGTTLPKIGNNTNAGSNTINTKIDSFNVNFTQPNQKVVYIATVTNGGTYNAKLTFKNVGTPSCSGTGGNASTDASNVCSNLTYTVTGPEVDSILNAGSTATYTITIQYNDISDASLLPKANVSITIPASTFTYTQDSSSSGSGGSSVSTENIATYITNLYSNATKTEVTNNSITYNYATSVNLMNDRLGGTTTSLDGGNIRYYGASPNNYIDIGDENDGEPILYRIIGVFDGKVKVIRDDSIGKYSCDTSTSDVNSGYGINEWSQADVMKLLNPGYDSETVGGSLWWNSSSGNCYNGRNNAYTSCDFTSTGLNDSVKSLIASDTWYLGGLNTSSKIYANQAYSYERGTNVITNPSDGITRTTTWTGKVGLMYPSDYGYAVDFNNWSYDFSYLLEDNYNWIVLDVTQNLLLNPISSDASKVLVEFRTMGYSYSSIRNVVRPVFSLVSSATMEAGHTGSSSDPYVLSLSS